MSTPHHSLLDSPEQDQYHEIYGAESLHQTAAAPGIRRREIFSASSGMPSLMRPGEFDASRKRRPVPTSAPSSQQQLQSNQLITTSALFMESKPSDPNIVQKRIERKKELETIYNVEANIKRKVVPPHERRSRKRRPGTSAAGALPRLASNNGASPSVMHQPSPSMIRSRSASAVNRARSRRNNEEDLVLHPTTYDHDTHHNHHSRRPSPTPMAQAFTDPFKSPTPNGAEYLSPLQVGTADSRASLTSAASGSRRRSAFSVFSAKSATNISPMHSNAMTQKKNQLDFLEKNLDLKKRQERELELAIRLQKRQLQLLRRRMKIHQDKEEKAKAAMERFEAMGGPENVFKKLEEANRLLESKEKRLKSLASDLTEVQRMTEEKQHHLTKLETNLRADIEQIQDRLERLKDMEQDFKKKQRDTNLRELRLKSLEEQLDYKQRLNEEKRHEIVNLEDQLKRANKLNLEKKSKLQQMEEELLQEKEQLEVRQKRLEKDTLEFEEEQRQNEERQRAQWEQVRQMEGELTLREKTIASMLEIDDKDIATYGSSPKAIEHKLRALKSTASKAEQLFMKRSSSAKNRSQSLGDTDNIDIDALEDDDDFDKDKASVQRALFTPREDVHKSRERSVDLKTRDVQTDLVLILASLQSNKMQQTDIEKRLGQLSTESKLLESESQKLLNGQRTEAVPEPELNNTPVQPQPHTEFFQREIELASTMSALQKQLQHSHKAHREEMDALKQSIEPQVAGDPKTAAEAAAQLETEAKLWSQLSQVRRRIAITQKEHASELEKIKSMVEQDGVVPNAEILGRERTLARNIEKLFAHADALQLKHDAQVGQLRQLAAQKPSDPKKPSKPRPEVNTPSKIKVIHDSLRKVREEYDSGLSKRMKELHLSKEVDSMQQDQSQWEQQVNDLKQELLNVRAEHEAEIKRLQERLDNDPFAAQVPLSSAHSTESEYEAEKLRATITELQQQLVTARATTRPDTSNPPSSLAQDESKWEQMVKSLTKQLDEQRQKNESLVAQLKSSLNLEREHLEAKLENLQEESQLLKVEYHRKLTEIEDKARKSLRERVQQERGKHQRREKELQIRHHTDIEEKNADIDNLKQMLVSLKEEFSKEKSAHFEEKMQSLKAAKNEFETRLAMQFDEKQELLEHLREERDRNSHLLSEQEHKAKVEEIEKMEATLEADKALLQNKHTADVESRIAAFEEHVKRFEKQQQQQAAQIARHLEVKEAQLEEQQNKFNLNMEMQRKQIEDELTQQSLALDQEWSAYREQQQKLIAQAENEYKKNVQEIDRQKKAALSDALQQQESVKVAHEAQKQKLKAMEEQFERECDAKLKNVTNKEEMQHLVAEQQAFKLKSKEQYEQLDRENGVRLKELQTKLHAIEKSFEEKRLEQQRTFDAQWQQLESEKKQKMESIAHAEKEAELQFETKMEAVSAEANAFEKKIAEDQSNLITEQRDLEKQQAQLQRQQEVELRLALEMLRQNLYVEESLEPTVLKTVNVQTPATQLGKQNITNSDKIPHKSLQNVPPPSQVASPLSIDGSMSTDPVTKLNEITNSIQNRIDQLAETQPAQENTTQTSRTEIQDLQRKLNDITEAHKSDLIALLSRLRDSQSILEEYQRGIQNRATEDDASSTGASIEQGTTDAETNEPPVSEELKSLTQQQLIETIQQIQKRVAHIQSKLDEQVVRYQEKEKELELIKTTSSQQQIIEELMRVKEQERQLRDELDAKNKLLQESQSSFAHAHSTVKEEAIEKYNKTIEKLSQEREEFEKSYAEAEARYNEKVAEMTQMQEDLKREYEEKLQQYQNTSQHIGDDETLQRNDTDLHTKLAAEQQQVSQLREQIQLLENEKNQLSKDRDLLSQEREHYNQLKKDLDEKLAMVQQISVNLQRIEKSPNGSVTESREEIDQLHSARDEKLKRQKQELKAQLEKDKNSFEKQQAKESAIAEKELQHTTESLKKLRAEFETEHDRMKQKLSEEYEQKYNELKAEKKRLEELEQKLNEREDSDLPSDAQMENLLRRKLDRLSEDLYKLRDELAQREARVIEEERKLETRIDNQNEMMTRYEHKMRDEQQELKERLQELQLREEELELRYSKLTARVNDVQVDLEHNFKPLRRLYTALDSQTITSTTVQSTTGRSLSEKRVVYMSRMVSVADCESIVKQSLAANKESNITGALICSDTAFIHIIEGKTRDVDRLYRHIIRDRRHHDIHCIRVEDDIPIRLYNTPMRFIRTPAHLIASGGVPAGTDTLSVHSTSSRVSPSAGRRGSPHLSRFSSMDISGGSEHGSADSQAVLHLFDVITSTYRCIEKYVPPLIINMTKSSVNPLLLPPVQKERIIMLVDVVRFAIKLRIEEIKSIMAKYLSIARKCVTKYRGDILQYTGNSIVAVFEGDQAHHAVKASMLLFKTILAKMPVDARTRNVPVLQLGVVLTQGEVLEGSFGCGAQMSYHVVGEHVQRTWQIASHLPELTSLLAFDKTVRASLKKQQSPYDNQAKHIGTVMINTLRNQEVELYSLTKKEIIFNTAPVKRSALALGARSSGIPHERGLHSLS